METIEIDKHRVRLWIRKAGGEISRNKLRRYRPKRSSWEPVEQALYELIESGEVIEFRNELEPLERGCGYAATRYKLASLQ
jgi:hypothetical protein